jgi:hypothetical protein
MRSSKTRTRSAGASGSTDCFASAPPFATRGV